ncbi:hypothetical protein Ancab_000656 [Ancistrocladus abbreviatus]
MGEVVAEEQRTIMVAVDEGEESMYALSWCLKNIMPREPQSTLILLHARRLTIVYPNIPSDTFSHDAISSLERRDKDMARWVIEKAEKLCQQYDVKVESRIEDGDPRDVICDMADKLKAHLLVMGSHGYGPLTRSILGSVSNHCVQNANCPVLVVKKPKSSASGGK